MDNLESERLKHSPNVSSLLKISLGLILFTLLSSALVYAETVSVDIEGNSFDIDYTTTGMSVSGIISDLDFVSLILTVDVTDSPGILEITFDRSFFDSTFKGADDDFIILADGDEPNFTETETTTQSRTLSINLPSGTEEVEIIGSIFNNPAFEPEVTEPEVTEPEVTEPEVTEPEVTEPEVTEPEVTEPEVTEETQKTQCGPGTILKDGACILDERCGPGTVLEDGVCVLDSTPQPTTTSSKGLGKELITGVVAAIAIAGVIGIILAIISKVSKSSD